MVKVFITVDTEVWPQAAHWPHSPLSPDADCRRQIDCYFWGGEAAYKLGLPFLVETLNAHGLRATFFVDPLFSFALGISPLQAVVDALRTSRHEIGLHLHPEWLTDPRMPPLPAFTGPHMSDYSEESQVELVRAGVMRLTEAGAGPIQSFRAGNWGANTATLRALARNSIRIDSSLNACFGTSLADCSGREQLLQPREIEGVWEFPLTYFLDRPPNGRRPLQICACSMSEFRHVLEEADARCWEFVVIVTHSFEFTRVDQLNRKNAIVGPRRLLGERFRRLCEYLASHRDRFETVVFRDVVPCTDAIPPDPPPIESNTFRTLARLASQAISMVY